MKKETRKVLGWLAAMLLIGLGFTRRVKKRSKNGEFILSIFFHNPSKELFEYCIKWLLKNKFIFLSQDDVINISNENRTFPTNAVIITVDDGWQSNLNNIVSVSTFYKIPIAIFISTEPVQNGIFWWSYIEAAKREGIINNKVAFYKKLTNDHRIEELNKIKSELSLDREAMTKKEVIQISKNKYITIGGHTVNHPILTKCNDEQAFKELNSSKILLEEWINKSVTTFAYPNGSYELREVNLLKELNYNIAYTTQEKYLVKECLQSLLELPRFMVLEDVSRPEALCRMLGIWKVFFN